jgi:hypothetical protein
MCAALPPPQPIDPEIVALAVQQRAASQMEYSLQPPDLSSVQVRPSIYANPTQSLLHTLAAGCDGSPCSSAQCACQS